jgi:hypothetical protein
MSKDFRSDRVRTSAIIGTGSSSFSKPGLGLLFYSSSQADGYAGAYSDSNMLSKVGTDVWMAVSGSRNNSAVIGSARTAGSSVLFLGDVVISGTLWAERSVVTVTDSVLGDFRAPNKIIQGFTTSPENGTALFLADPTVPTGGSNGAGAIAFKTTTGISGDYSIDTTNYQDVFFHVSGSRGVRNSNDRGLALFSGDVHLSGNLSLSPSASITADVTIGNDLFVTNDLTVSGNDIKSSTGTAITFTGTPASTTLAGNLTVTGNRILDSGGAGAPAITFDGSGNIDTGGYLTTTGYLRVNGNAIKGNSGNTIIEIDSPPGNTTLTGDLRVNGTKIKDGGNNTVIHLSGSGDATFNKNVTIVGDLSVSGSTVSIGVENLRVEDPVILMGSGSLTANSNGGIAIASGSSVATQALTFGRGGSNDTWRAGRKDVNDGAVLRLDDSEPVVIEAAGISFPSAGVGTVLTITGSKLGGAGTHMLLSASDGDITFTASQKINLTSAANVYVPEGQRVYLGTSNNIYGNASSLRLEHDGSSTVQIGDSSGATARVEFGAGSGNKITSFKKSSSSQWQGTMFISGTHRTIIYADGGHPNVAENGASTALVLSASGNESIGGSVIILSSSNEYGGGTSREGFIALGATSGDVDGLFTMSRHRDVRTLLSGAVGTAGTNTRGVTLATGDLVISGNTKIIGTADIGVLNLDNLSLTADPDPYIQFNNSTYKVFKDGDNLKFQDNITGPVTLADLNSLSVVDNTDVFTILGGEPSYIKTTGSFSFDTSNRHTTALGSDVYFFVSGALGSDGRSPPIRSTALFGGDVHVSGTLRAEVPLFISSLGTAYRTPDVSGGSTTTVAGAGAIIDTLGTARPVQIMGGADNSYVQLAITGSLDFVGPGSGTNRIKMKTDAPFAFHNSSGEVFRMLAGSSGNHVRLNGNNQINFEDDSRYIYGLTQDSIKKLRLHNNYSGGHVVISTTGAGAALEITGSTMPGADATYNLGSPTARWANAYTNAFFTGTAQTAGNVIVGGSLVTTGSIIPGTDSTYDLGSPVKRWANVYTGDLHLKNDRGNWTIYEEPDMLVVVNNMTGKRYKMGLTPLEDEE